MLQWWTDHIIIQRFTQTTWAQQRHISVCFCSICTKTEQVSFHGTAGTIRFPLNKTRQKNWKREDRILGRVGRLVFRGTYILLLGCYTSCPCARFAASPWTRHESIPVLQNKITWQNSGLKAQRMVQCWCLLAEREPCTNKSSADMSDHKACDSVLSSHRMIRAWTPSTTDTGKKNYAVLHVAGRFYIMCKLCVYVYVCVCTSQLTVTCYSSYIGLYVVVWCTFDGTARGDCGSKNESHGRKKKIHVEGLDLRTEISCCTQNANQNSQLWLSREEQQPCAHLPLRPNWGPKKRRCAFSECFVCSKKLMCGKRNATYRIKVGINGSSSDQSNCLAQDWHRGSKELGCSLLPIQISQASKLSGVKLLCFGNAQT